MPDSAKNTWTIDALARGDADAVRQRVLDDPNYLHERDYVGDCPLQSAIAFNDATLVEFLLQHGADPNVAVDDGYTCLLSAVESEHDSALRIVELLLDAGAALQAAGTNGWTPLHMAAARGRVEIAELLIARGAEIDCRTKIDGHETPLMEAAFAGEPGTVALLLRHGADASLRDEMIGRTPLQIAQHAAAGADPATIETLRNDIPPLDFAELFGDQDLPTETMERLKSDFANFNLADSYRENANRLAATGQHAEVIRLLTEHQ